MAKRIANEGEKISHDKQDEERILANKCNEVETNLKPELSFVVSCCN